MRRWSSGALTRAMFILVAAVHVRSWQAAYRGLLADDYLDGLRPEHRARRYTFGSSDPSYPQTVVAIERGAIVGFATAARERSAGTSRLGELWALYVDPTCWRRGIGRALIAEARGYLVALGFRRAALWSMAGNDRAERFYRADGWQTDGTCRTASVGGLDVELFRYERALRDA